MIKKILISVAVCLITSTAYAQKMASDSTPAEDLQLYRDYFKKRHPNVAMQNFVDGVYAIDKTSRESWEAIEEFPPYEPVVDAGKKMWETPFKNGKGYKDCFADGPAIANKYPHWDKEKSMVMTLPLAINNCLEANGEEKLKYKKGKINNILAYMAFESRGKKTNVEIPDDPKALEAYQKGKDFWLARRGQLNMSCAGCHAMNAGKKIRADTLSPAYGQTTGFPVYRSKWGGMGTLHRRFTGCNKQVRAKPFKAQGEEYRNLEFFLTYMSNGLELNGPSARK